MSKENDKDAETWGRDIGIFVAGMATGAALTATVGHLTGKVNLMPASTPPTKPA